VGDLAAFLLFPFLAAVILVGMHTWFGLQVLRRGVVFADLALAQLSALGATAAVAAGHQPGGYAGYGYALLLTGLGAVLLTCARRAAAWVGGQEAVIGILYVVATALTVLVVDRSPQGAEHVKRMLVGDILIVGAPEVFKLALLYGAVGLLHAAFRRPLLAAAAGDASADRRGRVLWDLVFYGSFGLVVTSSVALAGVLLVFAVLIVPAVIGTLFSRHVGRALGLGWAAGVLASLVGFAGSASLDLPTGAAVVVAFGGVLLIAAGVRALLAVPRTAWVVQLRGAASAMVSFAALAGFAQGAWLIASPASDQPLLALVERACGFGPERSMTPGERRAYAEAIEAEGRHRREVERLRTLEREARWQGEGLGEEELRRIASFQQTYNEMSRGERFVQDHLRAVGRARERWTVGVPAVVASALALLLLLWRPWGRAQALARN
jgi:zinc/manganese transport system permease protein